MQQNLANRLAAGGYWALCIAEMSRHVAGMLRERGYDPPVGSGSDIEVFSACGIGAFQHVCNWYMPGNMAMNVQIQFQPLPDLFDREDNPITMDRWRELSADLNYKRIALWESDCGSRQVSTVWTGCDPEGKHRIFESIVVGVCQNSHKHIMRSLRTRSRAEALAAHQFLINCVRAGRI